jgi:hypothetical protein
MSILKVDAHLTVVESALKGFVKLRSTKSRSPEEVSCIQPEVEVLEADKRDRLSSVLDISNTIDRSRYVQHSRPTLRHGVGVC